MDGNIGNHSLVMNLILKPLNDINDPTWSIIISIILLLIGVGYVVYWILNYDEKNS